MILGLASVALAQSVKPLVLVRVQTGRTALRQQDRVTRLEVALSSGEAERVPLTHQGAFPQGRNAPFGARVVGEIPSKLLIFTDSFASNPGNIQGECGGSETGERYLHVVSLVPPGKETFSLQVESCLSDIEPEPRMPLWDATKRTLTMRYKHQNPGPAVTVYKVAEDGAVAEVR